MNQISNLLHLFGSFYLKRCTTFNFHPHPILGVVFKMSFKLGWYCRKILIFVCWIQVVAIKQLDRNGLQGNREFLVEVLMLSLLHHPNLVNLIGYCADGDQRLLVYEYMPLGSLEDHLHGLYLPQCLLSSFFSNFSFCILLEFCLLWGNDIIIKCLCQISHLIKDDLTGIQEWK